MLPEEDSVLQREARPGVKPGPTPEPRPDVKLGAPEVTAIIPARNEEATIGACVLSLLDQAGAHTGAPLRSNDLEVLVADDGSTDRTAQVVAGLAARDPRVRLISAPPLPPGWVGKNHALDFAARAAGGRWLLFTDADTVHAPGGLRAVLERAEREGLQLFSLSPAQEIERWYERAVVPCVYRQLEKLYRYERINDPAAPDAAANGQYILIRREVYQALGGHAAFANEILEDVALARAAKRAGFRVRFEPGQGVVRTRMYRSFRSLWEGWTKNLYLLYGRRGGRMLAAAAAIWLLDVAPAVLLFWCLARVTSADLKVAATAAAWLALRHAWYAFRLRRAGERARLAAWHWPGSVLFSLLLVNSLLKYAFGRPLAWKGRRYAPAGRAASAVLE